MTQKVGMSPGTVPRSQLINGYRFLSLFSVDADELFVCSRFRGVLTTLGMRNEMKLAE